MSSAAQATLAIVFLLLAASVVGVLQESGARDSADDASTKGYGIGTEKVDLAILSFRNLTLKDDLEWLKPALVDLFTADMEQAEGLHVVPGEQVKRYLTGHELPQEVLGPETLLQVGEALQADFVLTGAYLALGDGDLIKLRLTVRLQNTRTGETVAALHETGSQDDLLEIVRRATYAAQGKLQDSLRQERLRLISLPDSD